MYEPIENCGVIGNMRTTALVGMHGSVDWYCFPDIDSPSVFGAILDDGKGGRFVIARVEREAEGVYAPGADQRGIQPGPGAGKRRVKALIADAGCRLEGGLWLALAVAGPGVVAGGNMAAPAEAENDRSRRVYHA
jgi:hypothetical protein